MGNLVISVPLVVVVIIIIIISSSSSIVIIIFNFLFFFDEKLKFLMMTFSIIVVVDSFHYGSEFVCCLLFFVFSNVYTETWEMVCSTCSDSMANLLSSAEGKTPLSFDAKRWSRQQLGSNQ